MLFIPPRILFIIIIYLVKINFKQHIVLEAVCLFLLKVKPISETYVITFIHFFRKLFCSFSAMVVTQSTLGKKKKEEEKEKKSKIICPSLSYKIGLSRQKRTQPCCRRAGGGEQRQQN